MPGCWLVVDVCWTYNFRMGGQALKSMPTKMARQEIRIRFDVLLCCSSINQGEKESILPSDLVSTLHIGYLKGKYIPFKACA